MIIFDPEQTFLGGHQNLVDFWIGNICLHLNIPKKSHLGQLLYIKGSLRLIRTYWAEIEKVDICATIRTYWAEVLKDPQLAEI